MFKVGVFVVLVFFTGCQALLPTDGIGEAELSFANMHHFEQVTTFAAGLGTAPIQFKAGDDVAHSLIVMAAFEKRLTEGGEIPWDTLSPSWATKFSKVKDVG